MSRIFISHSSADARETVALKQWLTSQDPPLANEIFVDQDRLTGIPVGSRWKDELRRASSRCEAVVCLLSADWEKSEYCRSEFNVAEILGKKIICARLEPAAGASITREWQRCDLFGDGPKTPIDIDDGKPPVAFATDGLERLKLAICGQGSQSIKSFVWPPNPEPDRVPYRGSSVFEEIDAGVFYGRDAAIVTGLDALRLMRKNVTEPKNLFVITGSSGCGKSSYLRAGLLPRLRREDRLFLTLDTVRPLRDPISGNAGLAQAIFATRKRLNLTQPDVGDIKKACQQDAQRIRDLLVECQQSAVNRFIERGDDVHLPTIVLPVDQADDLFTADASAEARQFLRLVKDLAMPRDAVAVGLIVVVTIRNDRYQYMRTAPDLDGLQTNPVDELKPIPATLFKDVITGPAERSADSDHPFKVDAELVERLLEDFSRGGGERAPILSLTLSQLYQDYSADGVLTLGEYQEIGELGGIVRAEVARVLATDEQQRKAQLTLLRDAFIPWLVTVNDEDRPMRRRARWVDLPEASRPLIGEFIENRLIATDVEGDQTVVEISSESLLTEWDDLKLWLSEDGPDLRKADSLERDAADWRANDAGTDYLWAGQRLTDAEELANRPTYGARLRGAHDFLAASRARANDLLEQEVHKEQAHSRKLKRYLQAVAAALVVALVCGGIALYMRNEAEKNYRKSVIEGLVSQAQAALAGGRSDGDARAIQQLLAARALSEEPIDGAVFSAQIQRLTTLKIIDAPRTVRGVAVSGDGRRIASASTEDRTVRIWDAETGKPIGTGEPRHTGEVLSVAFSDDGRRVVTTSADGTLQIWNGETGQPEGPPLRGHTGAVYSAAFSRDGGTIVSGSADRTVRRWNVERHEEIRPPMLGHTGAVGAVAYSPDGLSIASGGDDGSIRLWNAQNGQEVGSLPTTHGVVWSVAYSPDSRRIVSAGADGKLQQWDARTRQGFGAPMTGHTDVAYRAVYTSDGRIVSGGDTTVRVWDAETGAPLGVPLEGHTQTVNGVAVSSAGDKIVSGSTDNTVRVWDARNNRRVGVAGAGHTGVVRAVAINKDGDRLVTGSYDDTLLLWNPTTMQPIGSPMRGHNADVVSVAFSSDGALIASGGADKSIWVWDGRDGRPLGPPIKDIPDTANAVAFSPNGERIVSGGADGSLRVWETKSRSQLLVKLNADEGMVVAGKPYPPDVLSVAYSPDGTKIASAGRDRKVHLWDATTLAPVGAPFTGHEGGINSIAFDKDGKRIVSGGTDKTIRIWDVATGSQMGPQFTGHANSVSSVAFSSDGERVVSGANDNTVRIWDARTGEQFGKQFGEPMRGHLGWVLAVVFAPDGRTVISGSRDSTLRLWPAAVDPDALCDKLTTNMSHAQWREWVAPDIPYEKVCTDLEVAPD